MSRYIVYGEKTKTLFDNSCVLFFFLSPISYERIYVVYWNSDMIRRVRVSVMIIWCVSSLTDQYELSLLIFQLLCVLRTWYVIFNFELMCWIFFPRHLFIKFFPLKRHGIVGDQTCSKQTYRSDIQWSVQMMTNWGRDSDRMKSNLFGQFVKWMRDTYWRKISWWWRVEEVCRTEWSETLIIKFKGTKSKTEAQIRIGDRYTSPSGRVDVMSKVKWRNYYTRKSI